MNSIKTQWRSRSNHNLEVYDQVHGKHLLDRNAKVYGQKPNPIMERQGIVRRQYHVAVKRNKGNPWQRSK